MGKKRSRKYVRYSRNHVQTLFLSIIFHGIERVIKSNTKEMFCSAFVKKCVKKDKGDARFNTIQKRKLDSIKRG